MVRKGRKIVVMAGRLSGRDKAVGGARKGPKPAAGAGRAGITGRHNDESYRKNLLGYIQGFFISIRNGENKVCLLTICYALFHNNCQY
jgi:hypothetical protein